MSNFYVSVMAIRRILNSELAEHAISACLEQTMQHTATELPSGVRYVEPEIQSPGELFYE